MAAGLASSSSPSCSALLAPLITPYPADAGSVTHPTNTLARAGPRAHPSAPTSSAATCSPGCIYGARTSLLIVVGVLVLAALIGVPLGIVAGATGGWVGRRDHADHRHLPGLPGAAAGARAGHGAVAERGARGAGHRGHLVALVRPAGPGQRGGDRRRAATSRPRGRSACRGRACWPGTCCPTRSRRSLVQLSLDAARDHAHRRRAVVPRARRAGPDARVGPDGQPGPGAAGDELVGGACRPGWRS